MNKFKIRSGDFIGIIIPGIYLAFNLILPFTYNNENIIDFFKSSKLNEEIGILFLFVIASYIIGSALRLLSTDFPDRLSAHLRLSFFFISWKIKNSIKNYEKNRGKKYAALSGYLHSLKGFNEKFPYFKWYYKECITGLSEEAKKFFKKSYLEFESLSKSKKIYNNRYKYFFNNSKVEIFNSSKSLGEEVLNAEGLSRMAMGLFYASLASCLVIIIKNIILLISFIDNLSAICFSPYYFTLFLSNLILLLIFTWGVHQVRVKEAAIVFTSIAILKKK